MFTKNPKRKIIILALLALAGIGAAIGGSFAAYTSQAYKRGVVRNRDNETVRFTSNYLQACASTITNETEYSGRTILFDKNQAQSELTRTIYIYNYANDNENSVSQKDITYTLNVTFRGGTGTSGSYKVNDNAATLQAGTETNPEYVYTGTEKTLIGRSARSDAYTVTFPVNDLDKLKIIVTATPSQGSLSATNNQKLAAVIAPCTGTSVSQFTVQHQYVYKTGAKPKEYDGFNYEVSISSGKANAVLIWNKDVVEIDRFFLVNLGKAAEEITGILSSGHLEFTMDQANGTGDYLIPFYIKDKNTFKSIDSWDAMKVNGQDIITFNATQIEASGETGAS